VKVGAVRATTPAAAIVAGDGRGVRRPTSHRPQSRAPMSRPIDDTRAAREPAGARAACRGR
jgi:hypothetical protein